MTTHDFNKIAKDLQASNRRFSVQPDSAGVVIQFNGAHSKDAVDFDLAGLSGHALTFRLAFLISQPLRLINLDSTSSARIVVGPYPDAKQPSRLVLAASVKGLLEILGSRVELEHERNVTATVVHVGEGVIIGINEQVHLTIRPQTVNGLPEVSGTFGRIVVESRGIQFVGRSSVRMVDVRTRCEFRADNDLTLGRLVGGGSRLGDADVTFKRSPSSQVGATKKLRVSIEDLGNLVISGSCHLSIKDTSSSTFLGRGLNLQINRADKIHFIEDPLLQLQDQSSVVAGASGAVRIGNLHGGSVLGDPLLGLRITSVEAAAEGSPLLDAQLENVRFANALPGLRDLSYASDLRRLQPYPHGLPGWDLRRKRSLNPQPRLPYSLLMSLRGPSLPDQLQKDRRTRRIQLSYDADLMRKLSELSSEKGASGSTSTKVGWCAQRLRHEITPGFWERRALFFYRLLGYGERPGPPFLSWLVASLLFTAVLGIDQGLQLDREGAENFLNAWISDAVSPIGSLLRSGSTASDSAWVYLARAIVAVPLIVGVLALRKYTRAN